MLAYCVRVSFKKNNGESIEVGDYSTKGLMNYLIEKTKLAGHQLSFTEAKEDPDMIQPNDFAWYFGSFNEAARKAWDAVMAEQVRMTDDSLETKKNRRKNNLKGVYTMSNKKRGGKSPMYSSEELQVKLKAFYEKFGKLPSPMDAGRYDSGLPSYTTLVKYLGPRSEWDKIVSGGGAIEEVVSPGEISGEVHDEVRENDLLAKVNEEDLTEVETDKDMAEGTSVSGGATVEKGTACASGEKWGIDTSCKNENIEKPVIKTEQREDTGTVTIDLKITLPDREKPICLTLSV